MLYYPNQKINFNKLINYSFFYLYLLAQPFLFQISANHTAFKIKQIYDFYSFYKFLKAFVCFNHQKVQFSWKLKDKSLKISYKIWFFRFNSGQNGCCGFKKFNECTLKFHQEFWTRIYVKYQRELFVLVKKAQTVPNQT